MACMCGDTHCWSCGPAQGNSRCPICNTWADDGCDHIDEETGKLKPEFDAEAKRIAQAENKYWEEEHRREKEEIEAMRRAGVEIW